MTDNKEKVRLLNRYNNWIEEEYSNIIGENKFESIYFNSNNVANIRIDFTSPFRRVIRKSRGRLGKVTEVYIPCIQDNETRYFILNIRNRLYKKLLKLGNMNITFFKILKKERGKKIKYEILECD